MQNFLECSQVSAQLKESLLCIRNLDQHPQLHHGGVGPRIIWVFPQCQHMFAGLTEIDEESVVGVSGICGVDALEKETDY